MNHTNLQRLIFQVKTEIKRLSEEAKNGTFPTPSQLKVFTIGALELFLRYKSSFILYIANTKQKVLCLYVYCVIVAKRV